MRLQIPRTDPPAKLYLQPQWLDGRHPGAAVGVSWRPDALVIRFDVEEGQVRSLETDPWLVHRDSCAEFFFALPGSNEYWNIEVNPVGRWLCAVGESRENRREIGETSAIGLSGSHVGKMPFDTPRAPWSVILSLRPELVGHRAWGPALNGMRANFHICGDALDQPFYMVWNPICSPGPDFHRPIDFGDLVFTA